jgi:hypothetical protein
MRRYIVLYLAPQSVAHRFAQATPDEAQQGLQHWIDWQQKLGPRLLDPGRPLGNAQRVSTSGVSPSASQVIGMSILQEKWAEECSIEVLEEMPIPELDSQP